VGREVRRNVRRESARAMHRSTYPVAGMSREDCVAAVAEAGYRLA
jgi:hypothetical protein